MASFTHLAELSALRQLIGGWRRAQERIAFVPTMGALHEGHLSLVELGKRHAEKVIVSIFVNPAQFGPHEDLARYPRTLEADLALLREIGADGAYVPDAGSIYPPGFATAVKVGGALTERLDGASRPGHFDGVALVVTKLFSRVQPDVAIFGEKDWQQLQVVRRLVADLDIPIEIIGAPISREADGLARSSRNRYLTVQERQKAPALYRALMLAAERYAEGASCEAAQQAARAMLAQAGFEVDYVEIVEGASLAPPSATTPPAACRVLGAATLGTTRLIDNVAVSHG